MSRLTTHVLDVARGEPARGVAVRCERQTDDGWAELGRGRTDDDGRCKTLLPADAPLEPGTYRLTFDTAGYFAGRGVAGFFPEVTIAFAVTADEHHHVPLLLSPYGYSTYRGS